MPNPETILITPPQVEMPVSYFNTKFNTLSGIVFQLNSISGWHYNSRTDSYSSGASYRATDTRHGK